ncbi:MAG: right-handed parallel beta-helix repeat-containing protein [Anaerolineales bacterium]|nr:right-handed parallel beta-helix repeat-containing protein [Anaerolineales bacterium]
MNKKWTTWKKAAPLLGALLMAAAVFYIAAAAPTDRYVDPALGADSGDCSGTPCQTIQYAIGQSASGDILHLAAGTYNEAPTLNKSLSILGADEATTIINTNASAGYGLSANGDFDITLKDFSLDGPPSGTYGYGIKLSGEAATTTIENVTVYDSGVSGIDLNGLNGGSLTNITVTNNGGVGLALTDCSNITVSGITTSGNAWGGMALFTSGAYYTGGSDNITLAGTNSFGEANPLYIQEIPPHQVTNFHVNSTEFPYMVFNPVSAPYFVFFQQSAANAIAAALAAPSPGSSYIQSTADGSFLVGPGMTIQTAINAASPGDTVNVLAGTYIENANTWRDMYITKNLSLIGAGSGSTIIQLNQSKTNGLEIYGSSLNVTIQGITFTKLPTNTYGPGYAIRAGEVASTFTSLVFRDVEVAYAAGRNIFLDNNGVFTSVTLDQCNIHHSGAWGLSAQGQLNGLSATDSHFDNNGSSDPSHGIGFDLNPKAGATATNITVTGGSFSNNTSKGINLLKTSNATFSGFTASNNSGAPGGGFGVSLWEWAGTSTNLTFSNATLTGNSTDGFLFGAETGMTVSNVLINNSILTGNGRDGVLLYRATGWGEGTFSNITIENSDVSGNGGRGIEFALPNTTVQATCNWWGDISGPTYAGNPGGLGETTTSNVTYSPWMIYSTDASADPGWQLPAAFTVTAGGDNSPADNNYRSLGNAIGCVQSDQTVTLSGTFDFNQTYSRPSWELGNDAVTGTVDDWEVDVPPANNVTLTAASLGSATIQGPGDVATVDLEGFLQVYNSGTNQNWTISNLRILDFDLSIGMFYGGGSPSNAYDGVTIENNFIRMATDLKGASSSGPEHFQNIAIHLAYGKNQTVQGNEIEVPGDGISDPTAGADWWTYGVSPGWLYSSNVVLQSNTHGGDSYDGLLIDSNVIHVLNAQDTYPQRIIGIWENGWSHSSDVTVSNNQFLNDDPGNDPALNRQMAFRPSSHSSASTTVSYANNVIAGAHIGFGPFDASAGLLPILITNTSMDDVFNGFIFGQYQNWSILGGNLDHGSLSPVFHQGTGIQLPTGAILTMSDVTVRGYQTGLDVNGGAAAVDNTRFLANLTGVLLQTGSADLNGGNNFTGNANYGVNNLSGTGIDAENNFWGNCDGPGPVGPGSGDNVSSNVDYDPWIGQSGPVPLQALIDAADPGDTIQLGVCTYNGAIVWKPLTIQGVPGTLVIGGSPAFTIMDNDTTIQDLVIDMIGYTDPAIVTGADVNNLVLRRLEIFGGSGDGIRLAHNITNLQVLDNLIHDLGGDALHYLSGTTVGGVHEIQGNLWYNNTGYGVNNESATSYNVEYNSWGHLSGPTSGDQASGPLDTTPWTHVALGMTYSGSPVPDVVGVGSQITYTIWMDAAQAMGADFTLIYSDTLLSLVSLTDMGTFDQHPGTCLLNSPSAGVIHFCGFRFSTPANGAAVPVFRVVFQGLAAGVSPLDLDDTSDRFSMAPPSGGSNNIYAFALTDGSVEIFPTFTVTGRIDLQGRANDTGAVMTFQPGLYQGYGPFTFSTSDYWGAISASGVVEDTYDITVSMDRYLDVTIASTRNVAIDALKTVLNTLVLWGGDADDDDVIDVSDATIIGGQYGTPGSNGDINNDGIVDLLDMVLMGGNYMKSALDAYLSWTP